MKAGHKMASREFYLNIYEYFECHQKQGKLVLKLNRFLTTSFFTAYSLLVIYLFIFNPNALLKVLLVPLLSFIALSIFRHFVNVKRPYEALNVPTLHARIKKGKSFPSRHVFSAIIIAMSFIYLNFWAGIILIILGLILAIIRVLIGVHSPLDVIASTALALIFGYIGFFII